MRPPPLPLLSGEPNKKDMELAAQESEMQLTGLEAANYRMSWKLNDSTQPLLHTLKALMKEVGADEASIYLRTQDGDPPLEHSRCLVRVGDCFTVGHDCPEPDQIAYEAFEGMSLLFSAKDNAGMGTRFSFNMVPGDTTSSSTAVKKRDKDICAVPLFTTENGSYALKERLGVLVIRGDRLKVRESRLEGPAGVLKTAILVSSVARTLSGMINAGLCPTTGLFRKREFEAQLGIAIESYRSEKKDCALLMIDLDHFKRINDEHGHEAGDDVLRTVARSLRENIRRSNSDREGNRRKDNIDENDECFRWGGEEFVVVLPGTDMKTALDIAERLRRSIESTPVLTGEGMRLNVTASIGVADARTVLNGSNDDHARIDDLVTKMVREADFAMYTAKQAQQGARNRVAYTVERGKFQVLSPGDEIDF